jgi:hypothetical protein
MQFARRALALDPQDPQILYNNAVVYGLGGMKPQALDFLGSAIQKGYSRKEAASDPDLKNLANDPAFKKLVQ